MSGFKRAQAEQAALKIGNYGPAGSGKTFTSLLLAEGLARIEGKRVAVVDTEHGSDFYCKAVATRTHHPEAFDFDALYTRSLTETLAACKKVNPAEYAVIVIDSITHLWESARLAYEGRQTKAGTIPFHAWGTIKKPYKELMHCLLSSPMHVIICGRQGNEYSTDDETDELKVTGVKMKAEGETPYEPHILIRMEAIKQKKAVAIPTAYIEKDRTGVLSGKTIPWPCFANVCEPILPLLGGTQARMQTDDEVSVQDAQALMQQEREKAATSQEHLREMSARIDLAKKPAELKAVGKEITTGMKAEMLPADVTLLREHYQKAELALAKNRTLEPEPV